MQSPSCYGCGKVVDPAGQVIDLAFYRINSPTEPAVLQVAQQVALRVVWVFCSTCAPAADALVREQLEEARVLV